MPAIRFTKEDFLMGKQVKPNWYHALIKGVVTKPAKSDGSAVYNVSVKIVEPGDYNGIPIIDYMSEKAIGIGAPRFIRACNGGIEPKTDENYELSNGVGKIVKIHVSNNLFNGRVTNQIDDYDVPDANFKIQED